MSYIVTTKYRFTDTKYLYCNYKVTTMNGQMQIKTMAYEALEKTVEPSGNSGRVYVPKKWIGKKVKILLLEPIADER